MKIADITQKSDFILKINKQLYYVVSMINYHNKNYLNYFDGTNKNGNYFFHADECEIVSFEDAKEFYETYKTWIKLNFELYFEEQMIGTDPEIFVETESGANIPAFQFLGSKAAPNFTPPIDINAPNRIPENCGVKPIYWDGFQAEFTTQPTKCLEYQVDCVQAGLKETLNLARKFNPTARLSAKTVIEMSPETLVSAKPEHVEFGCMPSYNIYGLKAQPVSGRECPIRMAGGHIHFGIGKKTDEEVRRIVAALDAILGVACVSLFEHWDDARRRTMYGLAGEYRLPPHGLEYRTLSNAWLYHPMLMHIVFDIARKSVVFGLKDYNYLWKTTEKETIDCIQNNDVILAREILERNKEVFKRILQLCYQDNKDHVYNIIMKGMNSIILNPTDLETNWNLNSTWVIRSLVAGKAVNKSTEIFQKGEKVS